MTTNQLRYLIPVIRRLGLVNVATVALYRLALKSGIPERLMPAGQGYQALFFHESPPSAPSKDFRCTKPDASLQVADQLCDGRFSFFSFHEMTVGDPPRWLENPFNGKCLKEATQHWSHIDDFKNDFGDIKVCWELSRFSWAPDLARAYSISRNNKYLDCLNRWISSWTAQNPVNIGANWKCGQETGIRLLHLLLAAYVLNQHNKPQPGLVKFVTEHCHRIEPTICYAIAQNNNHGTSEAAALYVGGAWLSRVCSTEDSRAQAVRWRDKGRRLLSERVHFLVAEDGSFSQHSTVYHRLLLDTLNVVEFWRRTLAEQDFSTSFYGRCSSAVEWLACMTDPLTGNAPNIGSNDGASLYRLHDCGYRDFRPTVQLGAALFLGDRKFTEGPWDEPLKWLGLDLPEGESNLLNGASREFSDGGYVLFKPGEKGSETTWGVLRYPRYRFRPAHADGLHFDLWHRGINLLRDSGTYSYNAEGALSNYFGSTCAHNTVELDGRDQMPKLGRFLRGAWLSMQAVDALHVRSGAVRWSGTYKDYADGYHCRTVEGNGLEWKITDSIDGTKEKAVLRWRLAPDDWTLEENRCVGDLADLVIESTVPVRRSELVEGYESLYYLHRSVLPVWEVDVGPGPATLTTYIKLK